jgi:hypothetical protein
VAHAFLLGGHGECFLRREQQRSPLGQGADLLETRGRDDLSNRAIEVS